MSENDDLHKALMQVTAKAMALEMLLMVVIAQSPDKLKVLKGFESEIDNQSTRTLFESELRTYPEAELPIAFDHLLVQLSTLCQ
jgi:hypothetical protein